jgi:ferredoxin
MKVTINPIDCKAHGLCAQLLPEAIELDEWGYPILDSTQFPKQLEAHARRAAKACPVRALLLTK